MTRIIVDAAMRSKLGELRESVELCDESGHVLARVVPALNEADFERWAPEISREELDRRMQEPDFSTAEVLAFLEKL